MIEAEASRRDLLCDIYHQAQNNVRLLLFDVRTGWLRRSAGIQLLQKVTVP